MKKQNLDMHRRDFLKNAGSGSLAFALLPGQNMLSEASAHARGLTTFHFMCLTTAAVVDGVQHTLLMGGQGHFSENHVRGNGSFQHQDGDPEKPVPRPILGEGSWRAKRLVEFVAIGTHGIGVAGILQMDVELLAVTGARITALLEVVCNIPPGDLFTGKAEGYTLSIPGAPFGDFTALIPPLGIT